MGAKRSAIGALGGAGSKRNDRFLARVEKLVQSDDLKTQSQGLSELSTRLSTATQASTAPTADLPFHHPAGWSVALFLSLCGICSNSLARNLWATAFICVCRLASECKEALGTVSAQADVMMPLCLDMLRTPHHAAVSAMGDVRATAARMLTKLANGAEQQMSIASSPHVVESLTLLLRDESEPAREAGAAALARLATNSLSAVQIATCPDTLPALIELLQTGMQPLTVEASMDALSALSVAVENRSLLLRNHTALRAITSLLLQAQAIRSPQSQHSSPTMVTHNTLVHSTRAIAHLSLDPHASQALLSNVPTLTALISLVNVDHKGLGHELESAAIDALGNLASCPDSRLTVANLPGAIPAFVAAAANSQQKTVQTSAVRALSRLSLRAENKALIATVPGALEALKQVGLSGDHDAKREVAAVLAGISSDHVACMRFVAVPGCLDMLVNLLLDGDTLTKEHASSAMAHMAAVAGCRRRLGGMRSCLMGLIHQMESGVNAGKAHAAMAIGNLSADPDVAEEMLQSDVVAMLARVAAAGPPARDHAVAALSNLASFPSHRPAIMNEPGVLDLMIDLLTAQVSGGLASRAAAFFANMALDHSIEEHVTTHMPLVIEHLAQMLRRQDVRGAAARALANLLVSQASLNTALRTPGLVKNLVEVFLSRDDAVSSSVAAHALANLCSSRQLAAEVANTANALEALVTTIFSEDSIDEDRASASRALALISAEPDYSSKVARAPGAIETLVGRMAHSNSDVVRSNSATTVANVVLGNPGLAGAVGCTSQCVSRLATLLETKNPCLVLPASRALSMIVTDAEAAGQLVSEPDALLTIMRLVADLSTSGLACEALLVCLARVASVPQLRDAVLTMDDLGPTLLAVAGDTDEVECGVAAVQALAALTAGKFRARLVDAEGSIAAMVHLMHRGGDFVEPAVKAVANLAADSRCSRQLVQVAGMKEALLLAMSQETTEAGQHAALAIANAAMDPANRDDLSADLRVLEQLMVMISGNGEAAQAQAVTALANMVAFHDGNKSAVGKRTGGLASLVTVLERTGPTVRENTLHLLSNLAVDHAQNASAITSIPRALKVLCHLVETEKGMLRCRAMFVLMNLSMFDCNVPTLIEAGTVVAAVKCLEHISNSGTGADASTHAAAVLCLSILAGSKPDGPLSGKAQHLNQLVQLTKQLDRDHVWKLKGALVGISKLCVVDRNREPLLHSGVIELLLDLLRDESCDPEVTGLGLRILWQLALFQAGKELLLSRGVLSVLKFIEQISTTDNPELRATLDDLMFMLKVSSVAPKLERGPHERGSEKGVSLTHLLISCCRADAAQARAVASALRTFGYTVRLDAEGEHSLAEASRWVESSEAVIICVSECYYGDVRARSEATLAARYELPILPVRVQDGYDPIGWTLSLVEASAQETNLPWPYYFDFAKADRFEAAISQLVSSLGKRGRDKDDGIFSAMNPGQASTGTTYSHTSTGRSSEPRQHSSGSSDGQIPSSDHTFSVEPAFGISTVRPNTQTSASGMSEDKSKTWDSAWIPSTSQCVESSTPSVVSHPASEGSEAWQIENLMRERQRLEDELLATRLRNGSSSLSSIQQPSLTTPISPTPPGSTGAWDTASLGSDSSWLTDVSLRQQLSGNRMVAPTTPVHDWDVEEVAQFLSSVGLNSCVRKFVDSDVVGSDLAHLSDQDLKSHFGFPDFHVRRFRDGLNKLGGTASAVEATETSSLPPSTETPPAAKQQPGPEAQVSTEMSILAQLEQFQLNATSDQTAHTVANGSQILGLPHGQLTGNPELAATGPPPRPPRPPSRHK